MFDEIVYVNRREGIKKLVNDGILVFWGNNDSPCNYPSNPYYPFRQDSSFLYYFGIQRNGLIGVIDIDNNDDVLYGDDIDIEDIVWMGFTPSVKDLAAQVGIKKTGDIKVFTDFVKKAKEQGRRIHFLPPYRHDTQIMITDLLGIHPSEQRKAASLELIKAVVSQRSVKSEEEIKELEKAAEIGYKMHTTGMRLTKPGVTEHFIAGQIDGIANSYGAMVSFNTIFTQHGEIMHGIPTTRTLEDGRLVLCDAGAETYSNYCSDNTRTYPVNGKFTNRQLDIYTIVEACHDLVFDIAKPGARFCWDVHFAICKLMTERLKDLGLMKGNVDDAVGAGAHALFFPHGLGHMMGLDVHDMEALGQRYVGYDEETRPNLEQFGTKFLRMGRRLQEGFVVTDEPGIYFIPALIDDWRKRGLHKDFINYDKVEEYKDFGGIRIEDDILITKDGCRIVGKDVIPYHPKDIEEFMSKN